ncbi:YdcF family protein [Streptomyces sp. YS415]|uniref:YdcF family protein n=1 Tax=Streptomyces sp. YS415 TaxID=2944806 RepID=UPI002020ED84|nr:YdcF family protein [Streptomyces sp. YS415]MCL7430158.1 YdcF family protein [Streptomyces sp. YS415]
MLIYAMAAMALLLFLIGVARDLRRFGNAVLLGLFLALLSAGLLTDLLAAHTGPLMVYGAFSATMLTLLGFLALVAYLIGNGVQMARKEGRRPANLLSLLAGLTVLGVCSLLLAALTTGSRSLGTVAAIATVLCVYFSFLFACFVCYGYLYGRLQVKTPLDYIVVLGSGLIGGSRVPPLLAGRLDKAHALYAEQTARGHTPVVITSGGQGPDEDIAEAHAMAAYLTERGLPSWDIEPEAESRTTEENLRNSRAIMDKDGGGYRCAIVTNDFHAFRAALLARSLGVPGHVLGAPTAAYFRPSATLREFTAVVLSHKRLNAAACALLAQQCWVSLW